MERHTAPVELRHEHFRQIYLSERSRRESIRSSIGTPVAAISFSVFALGNLASRFDASRLAEPTSLAIAVAACASVVALLGAVYQVVMVEWLFVHHEPPRLASLVEAERRMRAECGEEGVALGMVELMTASYSIAFEQYLWGNTVSARSRTWALRLVLLSLMFLAFGFLLLPFQQVG
ncbi:hypothetical protein [Azospirillum soli]|uniref:hypothetical protein n=1 Tax=Azospirillum soli TaxID=1304799 RepID=UPI001AE75DE9|nr:hypothetical protein [Azospirillum soli]MBP2315374.1 putative membrane protein [Azospirillum soli]